MYEHCLVFDMRLAGTLSRIFTRKEWNGKGWKSKAQSLWGANVGKGASRGTLGRRHIKLSIC